jgi:hypothetical protein
MPLDRNLELFNMFNRERHENSDDDRRNRRGERFEARGFIRDEDEDDVDPIEIQGTIFRREKEKEKCCCERERNDCCCECGCRPCCCHNKHR